MPEKRLDCWLCSQTISAVLGVAEDTINQSGLSAADKTSMINVMPVAYAVCYIFGTAGSAWLMSDVSLPVCWADCLR